MAARTGVGVGMGVTVAVLGVSTLALFVLTFIFLGQKQNAEKSLADKAATYNDYVRANEQNDDSVRQLVDEARKNQQSALAYLRDRFKTIAESTTGLSSDTPKSLASKIEAARGGNSSPLITVLQDSNSKITQLNRELADAKAAADSARHELEDAVNRTKAQMDAMEATIKAQSTELGVYRTNAQNYGKDVERTRGEMTGGLEKIKREANDEIVRLNDTITRQNQELLLARNKIEALTAAQRKQSLRAGDEAALVDGLVVGQGANANEIVINRGRNQRVVLGMTFEVYGDAGLIKLDNDGNYPRGKASIEVIRVDDNSSTARVVRAARGQPVVNNDVIASAIYDPKKIYTFVVYGNFENTEGIATQAGADEIKALVDQWGGKTTDTLTGDVDFVVLGQRPAMPPNPPANADGPTVQEYIRKKKLVQEYDRLLQQAAATQIPVLNQNRLQTLIGK
ncbi:MAG: hypothetical protein ACREJO_03660 [Phycisphaerales bacterium]